MEIAFCCLVILGSIWQTNAVEWKPKLGTIKSQIRKGAALPQFEFIKTTVNQNAKSLTHLVADNLQSADLRLLHKDNGKTPLTHPVLQEARIEENKAISIFETGWMEYFRWSNDIDTEYKPLPEAGQLFSSQHYNSSLSTMLILHDRCGSAKDSSVVKVLEALKLRNFDVNYNIFLLDFNKFMCSLSVTNGSFKLGLDPQLRSLGSMIAEVIFEGMQSKLLEANNIHMIGLGMSTHLAGLIAKNVIKLSGKKVNSILGLDPPVRFLTATVSKEVATNVHIYHTFTLIPGMEPRVGRASADFVFGGAKKTPECKNTLKKSCFTAYGVQLLVSTILYPKLFAARWCPSYQKFSLHFCDVNDFAYVSFPPDSNASGIYQMEIKSTFPYGMGPEGIFIAKEEEDDKEDALDKVDLSTLTDQEYLHLLEVEVSRIRTEMISCLKGVMTPVAVMRCVMATQPSVRKMEQRGFIRKVDCELMDKSPTGKKCKYVTRTRNVFELPF